MTPAYRPTALALTIAAGALLACSERHGEPFTKTFIYGSNTGDDAGATEYRVALTGLVSR